MIPDDVCKKSKSPGGKNTHVFTAVGVCIWCGYNPHEELKSLTQKLGEKS